MSISRKEQIKQCENCSYGPICDECEENSCPDNCACDNCNFRNVRMTIDKHFGGN